MFTSGFHLAVSASTHLSPKLMGALLRTAFRSRGRRCHFEAWDFDCQYYYVSAIVQDWFCRSSSDVRGWTQQVVDFHSRLMSWHPQDVCGLGVTVSNVATLDSVAERCNYIVLHETWNERDRERGRKEGGRERNRKLLPLQWQFTGRDGGPLMVGPVCIFLMSNWGSEVHLFMSLHL